MIERSSAARASIRWLSRAVAVAVSVFALAGLLRLVVPGGVGAPAEPESVGSPGGVAAPGEPDGVRRQLAFLRAALDKGAGERAQDQFPEGYYFLSALYGLTWVELGTRRPADDHALQQARWALARLESPAGRAPFSPDLTPAYGVFYRGWTTWLRGGVLRLQPADRRDPAEVRRFEDDAAEIADAFDTQSSPYLEAYPGQAWPVDSTVAVASLRLHDSLLPPRYGGTVARWLAGVRQRLDPETGLLPHRVDAASGEPVEVARGSSQSVIHRFLVDIDAAFAREQYLRFRERFVVWPLGLGPAVREYPAGVDGPGDVDSGPLVAGVSLSASAVSLGSAAVNGDVALAAALNGVGELMGLPINTPWSKRYAFGALPIGDAFLAWSKAARPWVAVSPSPPPRAVSPWWRLPLALILTAAAVGPWVPRGLNLGRSRLRRTG
jgi:hypothetical protein